MARELLPEGYASFLIELKARIYQAQSRTALAINSALIELYWNIGEAIVRQQEDAHWGDGVIEQLSQDLRHDFPELKGFSRRNLYRMRAFYLAYRDRPEFVPQVVAQIPWGHNTVLLEKLKAPELREWYARATIQHGWSRAVLEAQIETRLHERQGAALSNFDKTLPAPQSELAQQVLKDPYNFDFLSLHDVAVERDLERGLLEHLKDFMLELGVGFSFVGSQVYLEVGGEDFYLDLLFYHLKLRCFVVIDLKMTSFKPEYAGKMNFYLSAVDDLMRHPQDEPSIGILLCKSRNEIIVEYALRDVSKPLGVSEYRLAEALPNRLEGSVPSIEELEAELEGLEDEDA